MKKLIKNIFLTAVTLSTFSFAGIGLASSSNLVIPITPTLDSISPIFVSLNDIVHPGDVCTQSEFENIISSPQISSLRMFVESKALNQIKSIADQVVDVLQNPTNENIYDSFHVSVRKLAQCSQPSNFAPQNNDCKVRALFALSDGTVLLDTARDVAGVSPEKANTVTNALVNKSINENHNTRVAIIKAQGKPCGIAYETKYSTTESGIEAYLALRIGEIFNNIGTFRFSKNISELPIQN